MRSSAGVGTTPPNVLGAPKPTSSVIMSNTLGAPFGGTTRGAHQAVDSEAFSLITPPNFGSGGGICFPSIVVVAPGEPGTPVTCWATAAGERLAPPRRMPNESAVAILIIPHLLKMNRVNATSERSSKFFIALA